MNNVTPSFIARCGSFLTSICNGFNDWNDCGNWQQSFPDVFFVYFFFFSVVLYLFSSCDNELKNRRGKFRKVEDMSPSNQVD